MKKFIKYIWIVFGASFLFIVLLFTFISLGWAGFMPSFVELENPKSNLASEIFSADQVLIGKYYIENRSNIRYDEISDNLIDALISTEDVRFKKHSGVDIKALLRVIMTGGSQGGGSTISQQLAKNLFPRGKHNIFELILIKLKEWVTAVKLERNYTKEEIIAMYFNTVAFGSHSYGIKSASKTFFNKKPSEVSLQEAAILVGVLKAPTKYSPIRNPNNALRRRNTVLNQMKKYGCFNEAEFDSIKELPIDLSGYCVQDHNAGMAQYFREHLRSYLKQWCKSHLKPDETPYNLYKDGLKIYTTINSKMQRYAEEAVIQHIKGELQPQFFKHWKGKKNAPFYNMTSDEIKKVMNQAMRRSERYRLLRNAGTSKDSIKIIFNTKVKTKIFTWDGEKDTLITPMDSILHHKYYLLTGLMSMEPQTGYVRAYVGGINYKYFKYDHVSQAKRQVGSTFKPFLYALAMQEGEFSPCSKVPNTKVTFKLPGDQPDWTPKNSGDEREGENVTLKWALANSVNYVSAFLMKRYSPQAVIKMARKMGVKSEIPEVPSICLGTPELSLEEMVGANCALVNKGVYIKPMFITRIEDKNGNVLETFIPQKQEAMSEKTAYLMVNLMKGVVEHGTGRRIRFRYRLFNPIAGKTGTTQNQSDGWFMGLTPNLVTGVWSGCEDRGAHFRSIALGQGANTSLPTWGLYMQKVYADTTLGIKQDVKFEKPAGKLNIEFDCNQFIQGTRQDELFNNEQFEGF